MRYRKLMRLIFLISLLVFASLACNLFSGVREQVDQVQNTAESVSTSVQQGRDLIETGQAVATQLQDSGLMPTVQAMATQFDGSGLMETAQAAATLVDESGLLETAMAVITESPGLEATAWAAATEIAGGFGEAPGDIPVMEGETENFFGSEMAVSYFIQVPYQDVLKYYESAMPNSGWTRVDQGTVITENAAVIYFEKGNRRAIVTLSVNPAGGQTVVLITLEGE